MSTEPDRAPSVAILGAGVLGARIARELTAGDPDMVVELHSGRAQRRRALASSFGRAAVVVAADEDRLEDVAASVATVVLAGEDRDQPAQARRHLELGHHVVATADSPESVRDLLELDDEARSAGLCVVVGAAFSPGLSCLLAAHAGASLNRVDEVYVARHGAAGPACARRRLQSLRTAGLEWRDGEWRRRPSGGGREIAWFPDPIGGRDCYRIASGEPLLLVDAFADLERCGVRGVMNRRDFVARFVPIVLPAPEEGGIGAIRVEVRGSSGRARSTVVLGALDRPGVAGAAVAAEAVLGIATGAAPVGAHGMAAWADPDAVLRALRRRGVRAAVLSAT